jgi:hypothetical protein
LIRAACEAHTPLPVNDLDTVLTADHWARDWVREKIPAAAASSQ